MLLLTIQYLLPGILTCWSTLSCFQLSSKSLHCYCTISGLVSPTSSIKFNTSPIMTHAMFSKINLYTLWGICFRSVNIVCCLHFFLTFISSTLSDLWGFIWYHKERFAVQIITSIDDMSQDTFQEEAKQKTQHITSIDIIRRDLQSRLLECYLISLKTRYICIKKKKKKHQGKKIRKLGKKNIPILDASKYKWKLDSCIVTTNNPIQILIGYTIIMIYSRKKKISRHHPLIFHFSFNKIIFRVFQLFFFSARINKLNIR